jgi:hypothetical protein
LDVALIGFVRQRRRQQARFDAETEPNMSSLYSQRWSRLLGCAAVAALAAYPLAVRPAFADEHHNPRIHHALEALRDAEHEINESDNDFHGEKRAALDAIDHAIERLDRIKDW